MHKEGKKRENNSQTCVHNEEIAFSYEPGALGGSPPSPDYENIVCYH